MDTQPDHIVVGVDGSDKDRPAVDWATEEAARTASALHVLYAFPLAPNHYAKVHLADVEELGAEVTGRALARVRATHPHVTVSTATVLEDPATVLVRASAGARAVVVGARGLGRIAGRLVGSVSQKVAAHADGVVVVVRGVAPEGPVVIGVDAGDIAAEVLAFAFGQAERRGVGVRLVHAREPRGTGVDDHRVERALVAVAEQQAMAVAYLAEDWSARYPDVPVDVQELRRHPVEALTAEGRRASLLVVGNRGRKGLAGVRLGSVALGVLHEVPVVAVVRVGHG